MKVTYFKVKVRSALSARLPDNKFDLAVVVRPGQCPYWAAAAQLRQFQVQSLEKVDNRPGM